MLRGEVSAREVTLVFGSWDGPDEPAPGAIIDARSEFREVPESSVEPRRPIPVSRKDRKFLLKHTLCSKEG